jgi:hypothetical protein
MPLAFYLCRQAATPRFPLHHRRAAALLTPLPLRRDKATGGRALPQMRAAQALPAPAPFAGELRQPVSEIPIFFSGETR